MHGGVGITCSHMYWLLNAAITALYAFYTALGLGMMPHHPELQHLPRQLVPPVPKDPLNHATVNKPGDAASLFSKTANNQSSNIELEDLLDTRRVYVGSFPPVLAKLAARIHQVTSLRWVNYYPNSGLCQKTMIAISQKQNLVGAYHALLLIYLLGCSVFQCTLVSGLHILPRNWWHTCPTS